LNVLRDGVPSSSDVAGCKGRSSAWWEVKCFQGEGICARAMRVGGDPGGGTVLGVALGRAVGSAGWSALATWPG